MKASVSIYFFPKLNKPFIKVILIPKFIDILQVEQKLQTVGLILLDNIKHQIHIQRKGGVIFNKKLNFLYFLLIFFLGWNNIAQQLFAIFRMYIIAFFDQVHYFKISNCVLIVSY